MAEEEVKGAQWEYAVIDATKTEQMPRASTTPDSVGLGRLLTSDKLVLVLGEILARSDKSAKQSLTKSPWVLRWDVPLQNCSTAEP